MLQSHLAVDDLRLLHAIGAGGSLAAAARTLKLDHSNAFRRLGAMERRLGVRLFELLEHRLAGEDLRPSGSIRITTTDTLVRFVAPLLRDFRAAHPEIVTELIVSNTFLTLTRRDADLALRPSPDPGDALVGRKVGDIAFAVYGAKQLANPIAGGRASLETSDWIGFDESIAHIGAAQWVADHIPAERIVHRTNSVLAMEIAARAGIGLALLSRFQGDPGSELARVSDNIPEAATPLWLLTHRDLRRVARVRVFLDFMAERIPAHRATLQGTRERPSARRQ